MSLLLRKIRSEIAPTLISKAPEGCNPRLSEVELPDGGVPDGNPCSVSLQLEFTDRTQLSAWQVSALYPMMEPLHKEMGDEGLVFPSVLKVLDL